MQHFRRFSFVDDSLLVDAIKEFPILYKQEEYSGLRNHDVLVDTWKRIAEAVGRDKDECKKRWRDIRDHFFKVQRKQKSLKGKAPKWALYEKLYFLSNSKRKIRHSARNAAMDMEVYEGEGSNDVFEVETPVKVEPDYIQTDSPSQVEYVGVPPPTEPQDYLDNPPQGRAMEDRPLSLLEAYVDRAAEDDVDIFMRSIALTVKRFPPEIRAEAKLKILSVITHLEFPNHMK